MAFEKEKLIENLGSPHTNRVVQRFRNFCYVPQRVIDDLAEESMGENWGGENFVMEKYLAVHVPWSINQRRFVSGDGQFYTTAGHLRTRYGTPLYLAFEKNDRGDPPYYLVAGGSQIVAPEQPSPPKIPNPPDIPLGAEIVMMHDHILGDHTDRVDFLLDAPPVAQMCAVSGAIQWSLNRDLELAYWYYGRMNYIIPLYLRDRENVTRSPDIIAPLQVGEDQILVRTVLEPHMPYANARVAVTRHDKLPSWLLDSWNEHAEQMDEDDIEDPEGDKT